MMCIYPIIHIPYTDINYTIINIPFYTIFMPYINIPYILPNQSDVCCHHPS